ncbi:MAG: amino acid ABC transporter permease [Parasporobacterium sp.]|nr:amino acid ABC transporter permease [Parasporobacterium sp.]
MAEQFYLNFIKDDRWMYLLQGLKTTIIVALFAVLLGVALGFTVGMIRSTHDKTGKLKVANFICNIYLTIIRGTPVLLQLLIIYFVVFASVNVDKVVVAIIAFGINSGAYVAEIIRSGIMAVDQGQMEAGRSLGFSYRQTMINFIMPQAFKNVLPALGNEFIVLLKETSVAGYIALQDLTKGADIIRSLTYNYMPLFAAAVIYLVMVMILSYFVKRLEKRLRKNER